MDTANEILDAIEILANKKISENITKVLTGICKSVNINNNTCVMDSNGVISTVQFYGSSPEVNELYRIFVPSNNMSRSFIVVPPKFTVNPNLLDNWYFGNPVNQRGQTEYKGDWIYTIDRWQLSNGAALKVDNGITVSGGYLFQALTGEIISNLRTKVITASILLMNGQLRYATATVPTTWGGWDAIAAGDGFSVQGVGDASDKLWFLLSEKSAVLAAKLELGPTQTLAHRESDKWVLNEVPDYGEQLRRCQRYFYRVNSHAYGWTYNNNTVNCLIPLPVTLRTSPVITLNESGTINTVKGDASMTSYEVKNVKPNGLIIDLHNSANALTTGTPVVWHNFDIDISADL